MQFEYSYAPKLSLTPSELEAYKELPDKDKSKLLPIVPLRGWLGSKHLVNSVKKIQEIYGDFQCLLDIDIDYVYENKDFIITGSFPRPVFKEVIELMDSKGGYKNWCDFILMQPHVIPTLQISDLEEVLEEFKCFSTLGRGMACRFDLSQIDQRYYLKVIELIKTELAGNELLVIFDLGRISEKTVDFKAFILDHVSTLLELSNQIKVVVSGSSFPSSFANTHRGENPIHERRLFRIIEEAFPGRVIYSDYGSARFKEGGGGGGVPVPRLDYPLNDDWRYIRNQSSNEGTPTKKERQELYVEAAQEIMEQDYWISDLRLWGVRMIELTALRDGYGIDNPRKSTAARINIHLYKQLHYLDEVEDFDTDEEWED